MKGYAVIQTAKALIGLALFTPVQANYYNGTTFPATNQKTLTTKDHCPAVCPAGSITQDDFSTILSVRDLNKCPTPMILQTTIGLPFESEVGQVIISACSVPKGGAQAKSSTIACVAPKNRTTVPVDLQLGFNHGDKSKATVAELLSSAEDLKSVLINDVGCGAKSYFAKTGNAIVGLYAGAEISRDSVASLVQSFIDSLNERGTVSSETTLHLCKTNGTQPQLAVQTFGIQASLTGNIEAVHDALGTWSQAKCLGGFDETATLHRRITTLSSADVFKARRKSTLSASAQSQIQKRATCAVYEMVQSGSTCDGLASKCGISVEQLVRYNKGTSPNEWCPRLQPDTPVCCRPGDLPDLRPKPDANGNCAVHRLEPGQLCDNVEKLYYLNKGVDLDKFNYGKTWGWAGCRKLQPGQKFCVSDGKPPMPTWNKDAICGPTKPGTRPSSQADQDIALLNPCPLKACCNVWGQCGTTEEFCIEAKVKDTPGTSEPGIDGCVSNCGTDIINNDKAPAQFGRIAYFEAWNRERPCLHMDVTEIRNPHTHIHFAFGDITEDFQVSAKGVEGQFKRMVGMKNIKRIISFGGWAFSNEAGTSHIMRNGVKAGNREQFAKNVAKFIGDNNLDGVDFDWEYPGADDIPGSDPGTPEDGPNYLAFLRLVRTELDKLGSGKLLAIAAPASYWYLRHFPIEEMSKVVDYIVYMSYDLHGQWDVGNKFVSPGCPEGNCVRSHVNYTATLNSLSMITKAGVQSNKVMVGITSYARSFKLVDPSCTGFMCKYLGGRNDSPAMPGKCTETGGYIADAEVQMIKDEGRYKFVESYDGDSDSDIIVYNNVEWLAYMTNTTKERRVRGYKDMNFAGASDWAVDLHGSIKDDEGGLVFIGPEVYTKPEMQCQPPCTIVLAPSPLQGTSTITIPAYTTSIEVGTTTVTITVKPDPLTITEVEFFNVPITQESQTTDVQPYPSISVPDEVVTVSYVQGTRTITTTRTIQLPPWPIITNGPPKPGEDWNTPPAINGTSYIPGNTNFPGITIDPKPTQTWGWGEVPVTISTIPLAELPTKIPVPLVENPDCDDGDCENNDDDDDDEQRVKVPCDLWFFNICAFSNNWEFNLPPGRFGPGPPPPDVIRPPPGMSVIGPLPPWPKITIPTGPATLPVPEKPQQCETKSASICGTTTSYGISEGVTTKTTSYSTCATIYGCAVEDYEETTSETGGCPKPTLPPVRRGLPEVEAVATATAVGDATPAIETDISAAKPRSLTDSLLLDEDFVSRANADAKEQLFSRAPDPNACQKKPVLIFPKNIFETISITRALTYLQDNQWLKVWKPLGGLKGKRQEYTAWFYVEDFPAVAESLVLGLKEVAAIISPVDNFKSRCPNGKKRDVEGNPIDLTNEAQNLTKRAGGGPIKTNDFANPFLSYPAGRLQPKMYGDSAFIENDQYKYWSDSAGGDGQRVYIIDYFPQDDLKKHSELANQKFTAPLRVPEWYTAGDVNLGDTDHGVMCSSIVGGKLLGVAPKAEMIPIAIKAGFNIEFPYTQVQAMMIVLDELYGIPSLIQRSVLSMSVGAQKKCFPPQFHSVWKQDILVIAAAGNYGKEANSIIPGAFMLEKKYGIIAGSSNRFGQWTQSSDRPGNQNDLDELMIFTSGHNVQVAQWNSNNLYTEASGTSFSAPRLAGLAAYLRSVDSNFKGGLGKANSVRNIMNQLKRFLQPSDVPNSFDGDRSSPQVAVKHAWNGQVPGNEKSMVNEEQKSRSCLQEKVIMWPPKVNPNDCQFNVCPKLRLDGIVARSSYLDEELAKRQDGSSCNLPGSPDGPPSEINGVPVPRPIEWAPGRPNPVCQSHCGKPCQGYWCSPRPTGTPPDHEDPNSPDDPGTGLPPDDPPDPGNPGTGLPTYDHADPSKNQKQCFNSGYKSDHSTLVAAAESFCNNIKNFKDCDTGFGHPCGTKWKPGCSMKCKKNPTGNRHVILEIKVRDKCEWVPNYDDCLRYMKVPINSCNCGGTGGKQGGIVENNCIYAMIDPNSGV